MQVSSDRNTGEINHNSSHLDNLISFYKFVQVHLGRNTIKLIKYTEEHINRFDIDKEFTEIEYQIPNNIYLNDITSDFVYNLHQSKNQ